MSSSTLSAPDLSSGVFTDTPPRDIAVSVRGLSKSYSIARNAVQHTSAGEAIMHKLRHPFEKVEHETFWALNDVSFDIQKGDVVGIIGRNGAGKSTLLKILSRITEPTAGRIDLYGRVGSLLEVGTGFHPELTGRENIFLNGAILGMKKSEIARQFDAIVDFSGTEQFLDTPVKRYSSGMYVRLAFAVAAHLNPEILIVDEVLAVGDAEFQKKCLGKMQDVAESGRTVLFVSHNMTAVQSLCTRGILLETGRVSCAGSGKETIARYHSTAQTVGMQQKPGVFNFQKRINKYLPGVQIIQELTVEDEVGIATNSVTMGSSVNITVDVASLCDYQSADVGMFIKTSTGQSLAHFTTAMVRPRPSHRTERERIKFSLSNLPFVHGELWIDVYVAQEGVRYLDHIDQAASFNIEEKDVYGNGYQLRPEYGIVYLNGSCRFV